MIDLDELFNKLSKKAKNRYENKYSYSEMITFADSAIKEHVRINENCNCEFPLIRTNVGGGEYCGNCEKNIK